MKVKQMQSVDTLYLMSSLTAPRAKVTAKALHRIHRGMGFSGTAVHFVIERDGTTVQTRDLSLPGFLAGSYNSHAIQVCLIGGLNEAGGRANNFNREQLQALDRIVAENSDLVPIYDTNSLPKGLL